MKKTMRFLSLAALALVGAIMTGCSNEDDLTVEPENKSNVVTLTTTVGIGGGAETRALAADGTKTFAVGETMAVIYKNTSGTTVKAVSAALVAGNITGEGKSATFTFTLEDPDKGQDVTYIYPAAMAGETDEDYSNLNSQDGTLATLSSDLDLATYSGAWDGASLPSATLTNQLAFLAVTLKDADGSNDITSSITEMTISDGTNTYTVSPSSLSTIYVAIQPTASANIEVMATDGSTNYTKSLTGKTYEAGNGYNVSWRMTLPAATTVTWNFSEIGGSTDLSVPFTRDGIVLSCDSYGNLNFASGSLSARGDLTLSNTLGKNFTSIVINSSGYVDLSGFNYQEGKYTWTGNASSITFSDPGAEGITSIVFTLE